MGSELKETKNLGSFFIPLSHAFDTVGVGTVNIGDAALQRFLEDPRCGIDFAAVRLE